MTVPVRTEKNFCVRPSAERGAPLRLLLGLGLLIATLALWTSQALGQALPTADGTMQVDHAIVSVFGVFGVETKNRGGWICGRRSPRFSESLPPQRLLSTQGAVRVWLHPRHVLEGEEWCPRTVLRLFRGR